MTAGLRWSIPLLAALALPVAAVAQEGTSPALPGGDVVTPPSPPKAKGKPKGKTKPAPGPITPPGTGSVLPPVEVDAGTTSVTGDGGVTSASPDGGAPDAAEKRRAIGVRRWRSR